MVKWTGWTLQIGLLWNYELEQLQGCVFYFQTIVMDGLDPLSWFKTKKEFNDVQRSECTQKRTHTKALNAKMWSDKILEKKGKIFGMLKFLKRVIPHYLKWIGLQTVIEII